MGFLELFFSHVAEVSVQEGGDERVNDSYQQMEGLWPPVSVTSNVSHSHNKQMGLEEVGKFSELEKVTILNRVVD